MASIGIRCGGNYKLGGDCRLGDIRSRNNHNARPCCLMIRNTTDCVKKPVRISATARSALMSLESMEDRRGSRIGSNEPVARDKQLDEWMRESVVDIVKNLRKAPLLVQVFGSDEGNDNAGRPKVLETKEAVTHEDWSVAKRKWKAGESPLPEGLMFVEQLEKEEVGNGDGGDDELDGVTKVWGILVQGKGSGCGAACYLLETTSVGLRGGSGCGCTRFCVFKVKNLRETVKSQFSNCWLAQAPKNEIWTGLLFGED
ncbi:hypothetical protein FNV43_RR24376 [Rhamnella rubrinervis]|uniref:DUF7804 domain-containing protein n=1 Tax=Rhamnella rubrinervis TaxID=2594499 RepID=A0A8K0DS50_9ROSA|nr:hypothetical protein FNV43_RR24376 [Rhamnella rubrinervis]